MKFKRVVFTHPISVKFMGDDGRPHSSFAFDIGGVQTFDGGQTPAVESIEEVGQWVLVRFNGQTKCIPAAKVDCADLIDESASEGQPRALAGRPRKDAQA